MSEQRQLKEEQKQVKFTRSMFGIYGDKRIWCFRQYLGQNDWGAKYGSEYYCYNCKDELIFRWKDPNGRDNPPFKVHEVYLESKERVNEYGRTVNWQYFKGYCCRCWDAWIADPQRPQKDNEGNEFIKCDCLSYIAKERAKYEEDKNEYSGKLKDNKELVKVLEALKDRRGWGEPTNDTYRDYNLKQFIKSLEKDQELQSQFISIDLRNINQLNEWEKKLKENYGKK